MASVTINVGGQILSYYVDEELAGEVLRFVEDSTRAMAEDITPMLAKLPVVESDWAMFGYDYDDEDDEEDEEV